MVAPRRRSAFQESVEFGRELDRILERQKMIALLFIRVDTLEEAESELNTRSGEASGHLRVTGPVTFGNNLLAPLWGEFLAVELGIYAVYASHRQLPLKLRYLIQQATPTVRCRPGAELRASA